MPHRATSLTAAAGEHYVAYKLSALGYPVAMTRGGSPTVDLMVGDVSGGTAVMIQVKTANWARRDYKRVKEKDRWEWDVGRKAMDLRGENVFYAFVDLKWGNSEKRDPDVFIVPADTVANRLGPGWSRYMHWIMDGEREEFLERWNLITDKLGSAVVEEDA